MEKNQYPVITVSREYCAGGRTYAKGLSEALGLPWYDQDLIRKTAAESGYSEQSITEEGETMSSKGRLLDLIMNSAVIYTSSHDGIFRAQKQVILDLGKEPCIIVGRGANVILREAGIRTYDIFLYADMPTRLKRAAELNQNGEYDLQKFVERIDHLRRTYYKNYMKKELGDYHDYDILLNSGIGSVEENVAHLASLIRQKYQ